MNEFEFLCMALLAAFGIACMVIEASKDIKWELDE